MALAPSRPAWARCGPREHVPSPQSTATSVDDGLPALRQVYVIKQYLQRSNDVSIALGSLPALARVGSIMTTHGDPNQLSLFLETISIALEVLRNHDQGPETSVQTCIREYLDSLDPKNFTVSHPADLEIPFLLKRVRSALVMCLEQAHQPDTFGGLVYDTASILLSQSKYDVAPTLCLLISRSFSVFPGLKNLDWTGTLYSVLDTKTALEKFESFRPSLTRDEETPAQIDQLTRLEFLTYCALEAAQNLLPRMASLSRKGYLKLPESALASPTREIRFKAATLLCSLQASTDSLFIADTAGDVDLNEAELASALGLRAMTARILPNTNLQPNEASAAENLPKNVVKRKVYNAALFSRAVSRTASTVINVEDAHLAIIELDDWATRRNSSPSQRVQTYFRENGLQFLLCPISERPMTDAIYVRCSKIVGQAALRELISGNIPASHCCCEEIHDDIEHTLHDEPVITSLAIEHLGRALSIADVVKYGDLPTLQRLHPQIKDEQEKATLLRLAIIHKNIYLAIFLIDSAVDIDILVDGETHLISAAALGSLELVTKLLDHGALPAYRDRTGMTALAHAVSGGHQPVVELLFFRLANTPLTTAISHDMEIAKEIKGPYIEALHELWLGYRKAGSHNAIIYLRRAMELDPENHLYAEEMQVYLDEQEKIRSTQVYTSVVDDQNNLYEGFMVDGVRSGAGKLTYSNANEQIKSFDGEWANGIKVNGLMVYRDGSQYHGDMGHGDERHGLGVMYFPTGAWYEGSWEHDEMHDQCGKYCFANGDVYKGSFKEGHLHGQGKLLHANGDYYEGEWENGVKHGYGTYDLDSVGLKYQGYWCEDKKHGVGWIIYPDGMQYKGEFVDDEPLQEGSTESPVRRFSTANSTTDGESMESSRTDRSISNSSPSLGSSKPLHANTTDAKVLKHQRSRSFAEIVGRKIKDPTIK